MGRDLFKQLLQITNPFFVVAVLCSDLPTEAIQTLERRGTRQNAPRSVLDRTQSEQLVLKDTEHKVCAYS